MREIKGYKPWNSNELGRVYLAYLEKHGEIFPLSCKNPRQLNRFLQDWDRIPALAAEIGFEASGFQSDKKMALYWEITRRGEELGYIYRGWDDPGFGIGESLLVSAEDGPILMAQAIVLSAFLAANGVCMTVDQLPFGGYCLNLNCCIYASGFNAGAVKEVVDTLAECSTTVKSLVGVA